MMTKERLKSYYEEISLFRTTYGGFPSSYWGEFTLQLFSSIPAAIKHHESFFTLLLSAGKYNRNIKNEIIFTTLLLLLQ